MKKTVTRPLRIIIVIINSPPIKQEMHLVVIKLFLSNVAEVIQTHLLKQSILAIVRWSGNLSHKIDLAARCIVNKLTSKLAF